MKVYHKTARAARKVYHNSSNGRTEGNSAAALKHTTVGRGLMNDFKPSLNTLSSFRPKCTLAALKAACLATFKVTPHSLYCLHQRQRDSSQNFRDHRPSSQPSSCIINSSSWPYRIWQLALDLAWHVVRFTFWLKVPSLVVVRRMRLGSVAKSD